MGGATTVLLALGPATLTGIVGYRAALLQAAVSMRGMESENERLIEQHREDERKRRLSSYHDFLTLIYRLDAMMAGFAPLSRSSFEEWLESYQRLYGGIELTASEPVRIEAANVKTALDDIGVEARKVKRNEPFELKFSHAYLAGRGRLIVAVEELLQMMRTEAGLVA